MAFIAKVAITFNQTITGYPDWNYQDLATQLEAITKHIKQTINEK
ncbi:MAG: hypothetical protein V3U57_03670 [Robiginitomaculum sp.]